MVTVCFKMIVPEQGTGPVPVFPSLKLGTKRWSWPFSDRGVAEIRHTGLEGRRVGVSTSDIGAEDR